MSTQVEITVRDGTAYLGAMDSELQEAIVDATSFKPEGIEYMAPKAKDPRTKLVRNSKCPMGLLDRVCRVMIDQGYTPVVHNADSEVAPKPPVSYKLMDVVPRSYQDEAQLAVYLYDRGVLRAPTGAGKTLIGAMAIVARGGYALIVVPTKDLLYQFKDYLAAHLVRTDRGASRWHIGQLGDGVVDPQPVTVATIRTISKVMDVAYQPYEFGEYDDSDDTEVSAQDRKELRSWIEAINLLWIDEAHILGAKTVYDVATKIPATCKYGSSASPWRDDGADLMIEAATGPLICRIGTERLVRGGYLMAPHIRVVNTAPWWRAAAWGSVCARCGHQKVRNQQKCTHCGGAKWRSQFNEAYREEIVNNPLRNMRVAEIATNISKTGWPVMVLVKQVKHGRMLADMIPRSEFLSGKDDALKRQRVFDQVREGTVSVVVCTTIADMGLDIPRLACLVLAGGGKSSTRHLQRIGRIVRFYSGKPRPLVVDLDDGHIHAWFSRHEKARRKVEKDEWDGLATWTRS